MVLKALSFNLFVPCRAHLYAAASPENVLDLAAKELQGHQEECEQQQEA